MKIGSIPANKNLNVTCGIEQAVQSDWGCCVVAEGGSSSARAITHGIVKTVCRKWTKLGALGWIERLLR